MYAGYVFLVSMFSPNAAPGLPSEAVGFQETNPGTAALLGRANALLLLAPRGYALYAVGRTLLELVRLDSRAIPFFGLETGLAVATVVSIVIALVSAVALVGRRLSRRRRGVG